MSRPGGPPRPPARLEALVERLLGGDRRARFIVGDLREEYARRPASMRYLIQGVRLAARMRWSRWHAATGKGGAVGIGSFARDLRAGGRAFLRRPALSAVVVATLGLGIGATTAIVSAVRGVLLAPLPYGDPGRLARLEVNTGGAGWYGASVPEFLDIERELTPLEAVGGYVPGEATLGDSVAPRRVSVVRATASVLPLLEVDPALGRTFAEAEDAPGTGTVVVLSHDLWRTAYGADPQALGRTLTLSGRDFTIVGVMPEGFSFPTAGVEAWVPLGIDRQQPDSRANHYVQMVGRLRPGVDLETAAAELERFTARTRERFPDNYATRGFRARIVGLHEWIVGPTRVPLTVLLVTAGLVLLVACANVANLLLVRGEARRGEMAVRTALGASRERIVRQLLGESAVLAGAGGIVGVAVALVGVEALVALAPPATPRLDNVVLDPAMLGWAALLTVGTGVLFGMLPALRSGREGARIAAGGARGAAGARGRRSVAIRRGLLAAQVALAAILALGAGLMFRTLSNLYDIDLGMRAEGVLAMDVIPAAGAYPEAADRVGLYGALVERLEALPGATRAAATCTLPLTEYCGYLSLIVEGGEGTSIGDAHDAVREIVTPGYFEAMGLRLVEGRTLASSDHSEAPLVAVVNETMARDLWAGEEAVGKRFRMWSEGWPYIEVVGVVADVLRRGPDQGADPAFYVTLEQTERAAYGTPGAMSLIVRASAGDPLDLAGAARALVRDVDATAAVTRVRAMTDLVGATVALRRFTLRLLQGFSLVALFLAGVGIYGVMAMVVSERRAEIGLRKALGAAPGRLVGAVLREGIALTLAGGVVGLAAGVVLARWMRTLLYEVSTVDVLTIAAVMTLMIAVAAGASLLPAWRAGRVDPMVALREEG